MNNMEGYDHDFEWTGYITSVNFNNNGIIHVCILTPDEAKNDTFVTHIDKCPQYANAEPNTQIHGTYTGKRFIIIID